MELTRKYFYQYFAGMYIPVGSRATAIFVILLLHFASFSFATGNPSLVYSLSKDFVGPLPLMSGPGGTKASLVTWLKANELADVTTSTDGAEVTDWQDHWTGNHDFTASSGFGPTFINNTTGAVQNINFNPVVDFNSANSSRLTTSNNGDFNTAASYTNKSFNIVFRTDSDITSRQVIYEQGGFERGINVYVFNGSLYISSWNTIADGPGAPWNSSSPISTISSAVSASNEYILTVELDGNGSITGTLSAFLNSESIGTLTNIGILYTHNGGINIGYTDGSLFENGNTSAGFNFEGQVAEFIYCNEPTSFIASDRNKIESYLAIKYGITLDQAPSQTNYVNAAGDVIFNTNLSTSFGGFEDFDSDIAGLGRDDDSELQQTQSRSVNSNSIVTMDAGASISSNNSFLLWGNDQASIDEISSDVPATITTRIAREWRVSETGEIGNIDVSFDISSFPFSITGGTPDSEDFRLLIAGNNSNANFSSARTISGAALNGSTVTFHNVNLSSGEFFTLGTGSTAVSPGGVSGHQLWLKANDGAINSGDGSDVTAWEDRSGNNIDFIDAGTNEYTFRSSGLNFNPTIDNNDGTNRRLTYNSSIDLRTVYLVTIPNSPGGLDNPFSERNANDEGIRISNTTSNAWGVNIGAEDFAQQSASGSFWFNGENVTTDPSHSNNPNIFTVQASASATFSNGIELGDSESNRFWHGDIAEVIAYNTTQTSTLRLQIESYLAIKFGITLDQSPATNYLDSNGSIVWNGTTNSAYNQDIAGIGRDDASGFEQKQSKSINTGTILTIGNVSIENTNAENGNSIGSDMSWIIWGNEGSAITQASALSSTDDVTDDDIPPTVRERVARKWKVQKTGSIDNVAISFDLTGLGYGTDATEYSLLIDSDDDMDDCTIISGGTLNGSIITFTNVNILNNDRISLGTERNLSFGPGGELPALVTWLKANETSTITSSLDGGTVTLWEDYWTGGHNFSTGISSPTFNNNDSENLNFNPNVEFNAGSFTGLTTSNNTDFNIIASGEYVRKGIQIAFKTGNVTSRQVIYEQGGSSRGINIYIRDGRIHASAWNRTGSAPKGNWNNSGFISTINQAISENTNYVITLELNGDNSNVTQNGTFSMYLNGRLEGTLPQIGVLYPHIGNIGIGYAKNDTYFDNGSFSGDGEYFSGQIAEFIYQNEPTSFSISQRNQTETYLAIKYGVTLDQSSPQNYAASDGGIIWNATINSTNNQDITAIGRDDGSILNQVKSKSANSDAIVTIANVGSIGVDDSWLIWGNNGANIEARRSAGNTDYNISEGINGRLLREWKVQETGSIGSVQITFDLSGITGPSDVVGTNDLSQTRLMVDADGVFVTGASYFSPTSFNVTTKEVTFTVNFSDGDFFTLGSTENFSLPIELISFSAIEDNDNVIVNWSTASEENNAYYTVERSTNGIDFEVLTLIEGAGNSTEQLDYQYIDSEPFSGFNFYRLKQTDFNGEYSYSEVRVVDIEIPEILSFEVYPNPINEGEELNLRYKAAKEQMVMINVFDVNGRSYFRKEVLLIEGRETLTIHTGILNKGLKLIRIVDEEGIIRVYKVLVQ